MMASFQQTQRRTTLQEDEFAEQSLDAQEFTQLLSSSDSEKIEHLGNIYYAISESMHE